MRQTLHIAKRELGAFFTSPVAYVFLILFLLLSGFFTFMASGFFKNGQAVATGFFFWQPWLYMIFVPAIGMRLWAEERRQGTLELLLTLPLTLTEAILGKFVAGWVFLGIALLLTLPFPCTLYYLGSPDTGVLLTGYLGCFLVSGSCLAISSITSASTRNQVISFISSLTLCLLLVLAGYPPVINLLLKLDASNSLVETIAATSLIFHFDSMKNGIIDLRDIVYFFSLILFGLTATHVILQNRR